MRATRQFVWAMRIFSIIYLGGAILFFFMPEKIFEFFNVGSKLLNHFEEIPPSSEHFWLALAASMMAMLFLSSLFSSLYPKVKGYFFIHILSKTVSIAGFTYLFLQEHRYFAYLGGAITDFAVLAIVLILFFRNIRKPVQQKHAS